VKLNLVQREQRQLDLFAAATAGPPPAGTLSMEETERYQRTGDQWVRSVISYLEFRCGDSWRSFTDKKQRDSAWRWEALEAIRLLRSLRYGVQSEKRPEKKKARA
jgi:hypothetical protein